MRASADTSSAAQPPAPVPVELPITLGQFLKVAGIASTGGEAKYLIVSGHVVVNGQPELRRGRHLSLGDIVAALGSGPLTVAQDYGEQ
jgi:ribosome-associated protein